MPAVRIAILGASVRAAAHSAVRAGLEPLTADLFADEDLRRFCLADKIINYPHGFLDWLRAQQVDGWMYTGALENCPTLIEQLGEVAPLWGNPAVVLRTIRDPLKLQSTLQEAGLQFPETVRNSNGTSARGTWLVKTYAGSSGSGVARASSLIARQHRQIVASYLQQYVEGTACAALYVAANSKARLLGVTRQLVGQQWTAAGEFQYCGSISISQKSFPRHVELCRIGEVLASRFQLQGLFGVDLIENAEGLWVLEVNPRYPASTEIVERATGVKAVEEHLEACQTDDINLEFRGEAEGTFGKAILFARQDVTVSPQFKAWAYEESQLQPWPMMADIPAPGTQLQIGSPVLTVFAEGDDERETVSGLQKRIASVEQRLYG